MLLLPLTSWVTMMTISDDLGGCIVWNPHLKQDIDKNEWMLVQVLLQDSLLVTTPYTSRTPGSITEMLHTLGLPTLQERRR